MATYVGNQPTVDNLSNKSAKRATAHAAKATTAAQDVPKIAATVRSNS